MYPSQDKSVINKRLTHIDLFLLPQLSDTCGGIRKLLRGVKDLDRMYEPVNWEWLSYCTDEVDCQNF